MIIYTGSGYVAAPTAIIPDGLLTDRLANSTLPSGWLATHPQGFNEFCMINAADGTNDRELFFDDRQAAKYIRFHDPLELPGKVGTASEKTILTGAHFPKAIKVGGRYYVYYLNSASGVTCWIEGNSIAELQSATPQSTGLAVSDFHPFVNPAGGYIATCQANQAKLCTASNPNGPWTDRGFVFAPLAADVNQLLQPTYASNQADPMLVFADGGKCYMITNGIPYGHRGTPPSSHPVIVEIDLATYRAKGRAVEFLHIRDRAFHMFVNSGTQYQDIGNPYYYEGELWYMGNTTGTLAAPAPGSITYYPVSASGAANNLGGISRIVNVQAGNRADATTNVPHTYYGTVSNTASGITTSSTASGLWNFVGVGNMLHFLLQTTFTVNALPSGANLSTVFHIYGNSETNEKCELLLYVDSAGVLKLKFTDYGGVATTWAVTGGVSVGVQKTFSLQCNPAGGGYTFVINGTQSFSSLNTMGQAWIYSLLNDQTDTKAGGNQMAGSIHVFTIDLL